MIKVCNRCNLEYEAVGVCPECDCPEYRIKKGILMWTTWRSSVLSWLLFFALPSGYAEAWTANEWLGVIEASAGVVVTQRLPDAPSGDVCDNCNGTGKVGDGTVFVECAACDGTGKRKKEKAKEDSAAAAASNFRCSKFG